MRPDVRDRKPVARGQRSGAGGRKRKSGNRPVAARSGQAAIEFISGLLLLLIVLTGLIHVNRMARTSLFLHSVLRGDAGKRAMETGALSIAPAYISNWQEGPDGLRYTADDEPLQRTYMLSSTLSMFTDYSVRSPGDWSYVASDTHLPVSMIRLSAAPAASALLGFTHAEEDLHVPVDPVIRQLVYDKDEVTIRESVWMPLMGGLY